MDTSLKRSLVVLESCSVCARVTTSPFSSGLQEIEDDHKLQQCKINEIILQPKMTADSNQKATSTIEYDVKEIKTPTHTYHYI
ncbi:hypothetical protein YC2023_007062 [Brassica napus]